MHEKKKVWHCKLCNKDVKEKHAKNHMLEVHSNVKKAQCDLCQKSFSRKYSLKLHKQGFHAREEKSHFCDQCDCDKSFHQK